MFTTFLHYVSLPFLFLYSVVNTAVNDDTDVNDKEYTQMKIRLSHIGSSDRTKADIIDLIIMIIIIIRLSMHA